MKKLSSKELKEIIENESPEKRSIRIERGIYHLNYPSNKGFRAYVKFKETEHQKIFAIQGSLLQAYSKAKKWREDRLREIQESPDAFYPLKRKMANNKSGVTGVHRSPTSWVASWANNGRVVHRHFAVEKYGEREAFQLACSARAEAQKRMFGKILQEELAEIIKSN
ncbi:MAG: AP2 domain-containing protein [Pyrinomonadaceae bacterium]|nr:AP2 domain-containing protein [Pyrinomonadaceae bacterium]